MRVTDDVNWTTRGACLQIAPDDLFVQGAAQRSARSVCSGCTVKLECLADALDHRVEFGVWGGMTERERRALLRRRPDVDVLARPARGGRLLARRCRDRRLTLRSSHGHHVGVRDRFL